MEIRDIGSPFSQPYVDCGQQVGVALSRLSVQKEFAETSNGEFEAELSKLTSTFKRPEEDGLAFSEDSDSEQAFAYEQIQALSTGPASLTLS